MFEKYKSWIFGVVIILLLIATAWVFPSSRYFLEGLYKPYRVAVWGEPKVHTAESRARGGDWPTSPVEAISFAKDGNWLLIASYAKNLHDKEFWPLPEIELRNANPNREHNIRSEILYWVDLNNDELIPVITGHVWNDFVRARQKTPRVNFGWKILRVTNDGDILLVIVSLKLPPKDIKPIGILEYAKLDSDQRIKEYPEESKSIARNLLYESGNYSDDEIKLILDSAYYKYGGKKFPKGSGDSVHKAILNSFDVFKWSSDKRILEKIDNPYLQVNNLNIPWGNPNNKYDWNEQAYTKDGTRWFFWYEGSWYEADAPDTFGWYYYNSSTEEVERITTLQELAPDCEYCRFVFNNLSDDGNRISIELQELNPPYKIGNRISQGFPKIRTAYVWDITSKTLKQIKFDKPELEQFTTFGVFGDYYLGRKTFPNKDKQHERFIGRYEIESGKSDYFEYKNAYGKLVISANGKYVIYAHKKDFYVLDVDTNEQIKLFPKKKYVEKLPSMYGATFSEDGCKVALEVRPHTAELNAPAVPSDLCPGTCFPNVIVGTNPHCEI